VYHGDIRHDIPGELLHPDRVDMLRALCCKYQFDASHVEGMLVANLT